MPLVMRPALQLALRRPPPAALQLALRRPPPAALPFAAARALHSSAPHALWFARSAPRRASVESAGSASKGSGIPTVPVAVRGAVVPQREALQDSGEPGWHVGGRTTYTEEELNAVRVVHKELRGASDHVAAFLVRVMRTAFDVVTRYPSHSSKFPALSEEASSSDVAVPSQAADAAAVRPGRAQRAAARDGSLPSAMPLAEMRRKGLSFGPEQWLVRIVFLETVAGVPGFAAAMVRHLQSLRLLRRDGGWIGTLLEDAENERMHLMVALKLYHPGIFMRAMIASAQAVFTAFFSAMYLVAPRVAHRFVGILEEEAVLTYTNILRDLESGRLPEWTTFPAPPIAISYWGLPQDAKLSHVIRALRADEANHRFINHSLASLKSTDFNPFAYGNAPAELRGSTWGLERDEALAYFEREDAKRRGIASAPRAEGAAEADGEASQKQQAALQAQSSDAEMQQHDAAARSHGDKADAKSLRQ